MKKSVAIASGALVLALAVTPAVYAAQAAVQPETTVAEIELTNATPSVQQEGSVTVEKGTITLEDGTKITPTAYVDGVASEELEVYVTGATDVSFDAATGIGEAQEVANAALAVAQETGNTAQSMLDTNPELAQEGLSATSIITTEFYLGIQDKKGKPYTGDATVALNLPSEEEAKLVSMVLYYNATAKKWVTIPFSRSANKIILITRYTGVYRFVTNV